MSITIDQITLDTPVDDGLVALSAYGKPRLSRMDKGWLCSVEVHSSAKGASIDVRSEFNCQTPKQAMLQCCVRLHDLVTSITAASRSAGGLSLPES